MNQDYYLALPWHFKDEFIREKSLLEMVENLYFHYQI